MSKKPIPYRFYSFEEMKEDIKIAEDFEDMDFNEAMEFDKYKYVNLYSNRFPEKIDGIHIVDLLKQITDFLITNRVPLNFEIPVDADVLLYLVDYDMENKEADLRFKTLTFVQGFDHDDSEALFDKANEMTVNTSMIMVFDTRNKIIQIMEKSKESMH